MKSKTDWESLKNMKDSDIDYSDIPEVDSMIKKTYNVHSQVTVPIMTTVEADNKEEALEIAGAVNDIEYRDWCEKEEYVGKWICTDIDGAIDFDIVKPHVELEDDE